MVTGDNLQTAKAIALQCEVLTSIEDYTEHTVIEGRVFREYTQNEREKIATKVMVWL